MLGYEIYCNLYYKKILPKTLFLHIYSASPHNIDKFVEEIGQVYGNIKIALMRELTKKFEEHLIGTPEEITAHFKAHPPKGEFVLIFNPQDKSGL